MPLPFLLGAALQGGLLYGADKYKDSQSRDRMDEARQRVQGLLGERAKPYEMSGAEMFPGEQQIPGLQQAGSGLLGGEMGPAEFYGGLMTTPGYEDAGMKGLMEAMAPQDAPDMTSLQRNLASMGLQPGSEEWNRIMRETLIKPSTQVNVGKDYKQGELQAGAFANRMAQAEQELTALEESGFDPGSASEAYPASIPLIGNYLASPEMQSYQQAQRDWVRSKLRKESGATIGDEEMAEEIRTYFPQPGDSKEVRERKQRARRLATQNMVKESSGAYENVFATPVQPIQSQPEERPPLSTFVR